MRRDSLYMKKTTEQLIEAYAFECGRINDRDREISQRAIKNELKVRFEMCMRALDSDRIADNPKGVYDRLING